MKKNAFTLIEVILVVIIIGLILSATIGMWTTYLKTLQTKSDKERVVSLLDYVLSYTRSSNYFRNIKYSYADIIFVSTWASVVLDTGTGFDSAILYNTIISSWSNETIRLTPYSIACTQVSNPTATWFYFTIQSSINNDSYCFVLKLDVCKTFSIPCP